MLNTINNDKTIGRNFADRRRNCRHINRHARNWRGVKNGRNAGFRRHMRRIILRGHTTCSVIMRNQNIRFTSDFSPAGASAASGRVLQCRAKDGPTRLNPKTGIHNQTKQKFGATFTHKKAA